MSNNLKNTIAIPAGEYNYLKKIERSIENFFGSFAHLKEIEKARKEIKQKNIFLKKLFLKSWVFSSYENKLYKKRYS